MSGTAAFKDHFSPQAADYQRYRPDYPAELFAWLASVAPARHLAVDVATGNGQAAISLAEHFDSVFATDASAAQIREARSHARVRYACEPAEATSLADRSANLLVAAQAAHWFDWAAFCAEARRILRARGVAAIWCYGLFNVDERIDRLVGDFSRDAVGPWWPRERRHVEEDYRELVLPGAAVAAPEFHMQALWDLPTVLGYLGTWSAVHRALARTRRDPLVLVEAPLRSAWGAGVRRVRWPLVLRVHRVR